MISFARRAATATASALAIFGCNSILDNTPGTVVTADEAGTEPGPSLDSGAPTTPPVTGDDTGNPPPPPPDDAGTIPTPGCATGQHMCGGTCAGNADAVYGCGKASCDPCKLAHATATCNGTACAVGTCDPGWADCNANPADGCEIDLSKATSCGGCSATCPPLTPFCAPAVGGFACTNGCPPAAPLICGKDCVDPQTSAANCGTCGHACPDVPNGTTTCTVGACGFTCKPQFHACGTKCMPVTDPTACGAACTVCPAPPNAQASCPADACAFMCNPGFADCDAAPANGCEAKLANDPLNCGACGKSCAGGTCNAGVCTLPDGGH